MTSLLKTEDSIDVENGSNNEVQKTLTSSHRLHVSHSQYVCGQLRQVQICMWDPR